MVRSAMFILACGVLLGACGGGGSDRPPSPGTPGTPGTPGNPGTPGPTGGLRFALATISIREAAGTLALTIERVGGSNGAISTVVKVVGGNATADQDYRATNALISFADGDTVVKTVSLTILDDAAAEPDETVTLQLTDPASGAMLADTVTITIQDDDTPVAPSLAIAPEIKKLAFSWLGVGNATAYKLMRRERSEPAFVQVGADLPPTATSTKIGIPVHIYEWAPNAPQYRLDACNAGVCASSNIATTIRELSVAATGYIKASTLVREADFGRAVAVSADGRTVAIGAPLENNGAGSVHIYMAATVGDRVLAARPIKITPPSAQAMLFGFSLALSEDGRTLAVGAPFDDHRQSGVGTYPTTPNSGAPHSGGVFIYSRVGNKWSETPTYLKASDVDSDDKFGFALALSGTTLAIGAPHQDSPTEGDDTTNAAVDSGATYVFSASSGAWLQAPRILKASNIGNGDNFGSSVAMSAGGSVLLVGAPFEDGDGTGIDPVDADTKLDSGAVYRFFATGGGLPENPPTLSTPQRLKANNSGAGDNYGSAVAIDSSGNVFAVGAPAEDSTSIENPNADGTNIGAVYSYVTTTLAAIDNTSINVAYLKPTRRDNGMTFGTSVAISGNGRVLAVGSPGEAATEIGVGGRVDAPLTTPNSGAVEILVRPLDSNWSTPLSRHYVKAINTDADDIFGHATALSEDGNMLVVGAPSEDGHGTNIDGNNNPSDNSGTNSGAVYLY